MSTIELPVLVLNPHMALAQTAEAQRPKVDVPDPVVDLLEADVFADADRGDVDPAAVPPHAPVGADVPDFEAVRVLEGRQPIRHRPRRRAVTRRRRLLVERCDGPTAPMAERLLVVDAMGRRLPGLTHGPRSPAARRA